MAWHDALRHAVVAAGGASACRRLAYSHPSPKHDAAPRQGPHPRCARAAAELRCDKRSPQAGPSISPRQQAAHLISSSGDKARLDTGPACPASSARSPDNPKSEPPAAPLGRHTRIR